MYVDIDILYVHMYAYFEFWVKKDFLTSFSCVVNNSFVTYFSFIKVT